MTGDVPASDHLKVDLSSEDETRQFGLLLGGLSSPGDVIALSGDLGAGKTCLAQGIARGLDIVGHVPSPTFNLLLVHQGRLVLNHFDLYRLDRADQLEDLDFYETLESGGVSVIEWADRFPGALPDDRLDVALTATSEKRRTLALTPHGPRAEALATEVRRGWLILRTGRGGE